MLGFQVVHAEDVRFSDAGPGGLVPDPVLSTYLEQARLAWFAQTGAEDEPSPLVHRVDMILARTELDVHDDLRFPARVEIGVRAGRVGTKSFVLEYELRKGERLVAEARSVLVAIDYASGRTTPIPEHWRRRLEPAKA
jgi:acyl-CoA thioester hydrolase